MVEDTVSDHSSELMLLQGAEGIPKGFAAYVAFSLVSNCTKQLLQVGWQVLYIHQYRIDEYAEYLYREKRSRTGPSPHLEVVKEAIAEADFTQKITQYKT